MRTKSKILALHRKNRRAGDFTPPSLKEVADGTRGTIQVPRNARGGNSNSGAIDVETGVFYVTSQTPAPPKEGAEVPAFWKRAEYDCQRICVAT